MEHFRKVWTEEINEWIKTTKGIKHSEAYALFLNKFPEIKDVTEAAFISQRSVLKSSGRSNVNYLPTRKPLYSEQEKKGYIRIKIAQPDVWIQKSKWVYMETHPWEDFTERSNYIFLDGNTRNFDPDNIERVPLRYMSVFCHIGGCEKGHPEITRLRLLQAKLKVLLLDKGEELGLVVANNNSTGRVFIDERNAKAREYQNRDYVKERKRQRAKEYYKKIKAEGGERWEHLREVNRRASRKYKRNKSLN